MEKTVKVPVESLRILLTFAGIGLEESGYFPNDPIEARIPSFSTLSDGKKSYKEIVLILASVD
jgi:hypothetical protein